MDGHIGLLTAIEDIQRNVEHQLCWAHRMRNMGDRMRTVHRAMVIENLRHLAGTVAGRGSPGSEGL